MNRKNSSVKNISEILFDQLWSISTDGMRITDEHGIIIDVNDAFCSIVNKSKNELVKKPFIFTYHPDEHKDILKMYNRNLQENTVKTHFEVERALWNGKKIWLEFTNSIIETSSHGKIILSIVKDITQRKKSQIDLQKSEKRYRMLFNYADDAVFVNHLIESRRFSNFIEVNDVASRQLGYTRDELLNLDFDQIVLPKYIEKVNGLITKLLIEKHVIFDIVYVANDKREIPVEISSRLFEFDNRPTVLSIARDITRRKQVEMRLKKTSEQLRNLASHQQSIREEERKIIAREIHDELGQVLTVLKIQISLLAHKLRDDQKFLKEKIESVTKVIDQTVESVQRISAKLRPGILDELGLIPAIEWQSQDFAERTGIACDCSLLRGDITLDKEKSTAIFRIFQEALTNVARHANAKKISVNITKHKDHLTLEVTDNGNGIRQSQIDGPNSLGILGMKERALIWGGTVNINGVDNKGTNVKVEMPINEFEN